MLLDGGAGHQVHLRLTLHLVGEFGRIGEVWVAGERDHSFFVFFWGGISKSGSVAKSFSAPLIRTQSQRGGQIMGEGKVQSLSHWVFGFQYRS